MRLLSLKDFSLRQTDQVYRASAIASAMGTLMSVTAVAMAGYLLVEGRIGSFDPPKIVVIGSGLFFLLFVWLTSTTWIAARHPTNWILRIRMNEVFIKFRSFENWRMNENDPQVIELQRSEIAFVRIFCQKQLSQGGSDRTTRIDQRVDLEMGLKNVDLSQLQQAISQEQQRPGWGNDHHRTKFLDYPVEVTSDSIHINWRCASAIIRPGIKHVLNELGRLTQTKETEHTNEDFTPRTLKNLDASQQRKKLVELSVRDPIAAIQAVKELRHCTLSEASRLIKEWTAESNGAIV